LRYLVTGAAGFIGSHIVEQLLVQDQVVTAVDNFDETLRDATPRREWWEEARQAKNLTLIEGDLTQLRLSEILEGVDVVINQAATPGLMPSWVSFDRYLSNNVLATQLLAEAVTNSKVQKVVHASTSSVYGLNAIGDESQQTRPISPYGISKLASELIWSAYGSRMDCPVTILRYFSVYGPRQRNDMAWSIFIKKLFTGQQIEITGDGSQSRSNTYVRDVAEVTIAAGQPKSASGTFNISGDEHVSTIDALRLIAEEIGVEPDIQLVAPRRGDQSQTKGINTAAKEHLGFQNRTSLIEGIKAQVAWAKQHPYW